MLGGVGVVEVAVRTVTAAVLIRGNIEPSHFGFLHAGHREKSDAASNTELLLSLAVNRPAQLPAKVQAVHQDRSARPLPRPGHVTPPGGAARLIRSRPASGKVPAERKGRGRAEGRKSTDSRAAENKDGPNATPRLPKPAPPDPEASQRILAIHPLRDSKSQKGMQGARFCSPPPL